MMTVSLLLVASLANALSQTFLKIGVTRLSLSGDGPMAAILRLAASVHIWTGLVLFCLSLVIYIFLLSQNEISLIFPAMGATYLFVIAIAACVLRERIDVWRLSGAGMVSIGLALLAVGNE